MIVASGDASIAASISSGSLAGGPVSGEPPTGVVVKVLPPLQAAPSAHAEADSAAIANLVARLRLVIIVPPFVLVETGGMRHRTSAARLQDSAALKTPIGACRTMLRDRSRSRALVTFEERGEH
jgi:hypothetical protein